MKTGKLINFGDPLKYPLSPVPISITNANGSKKINKSTLHKIILKNNSNNVVPDIFRESTAYIVHFMATNRTMKEVPETFEGLA